MNEKTIIDELIDIFRIFDRDEDGFIDRSELKQLMSSSESSKLK
jgi:Ca2+-binding EF-hand superfamily protein